MRWISENLQLVLAVAGALAWWLTQRKQPAKDASPPTQEEESFEDPELAERTRRIREEIQRKIEQRARGYAHEQPKPVRPDPAELPPILRDIFQEPEPELPPPAVAPPASRLEVQRQAEILEQQAAMAEQLRQAKLTKAAAQKREVFEAATADHSAARRTESRSSVLGELRTPEALRRAFILREVLGPPVALRR